MKQGMRTFLAGVLGLSLAAGLFTGSALAEGNEPPEMPGGGPGMANSAQGMPGGQSFSGEYSAVVTYSEDASESGWDYTSSGKDENAVLVTGGNVTLSGVTVERSSSDSTGGDNSSFYGVGAAVLATDGMLTVSDSTISTDSAGGAGIFAYGDSTVTVENTVIATEQNTSGGIHAAGGGTLYANNVTATTQGESSAAIRSDRGGGLMVISGGEYTSNGIGSPAVYCTATIAAEDAVLRANGSEAVCIEGLNSLYLYDCDLSGAMKDNEQNDCTWNVILYQSMSGDSQEGNSTFQMVGGTLTAENGGMFYTTNTESTFILENVTLVPAEDAEFLLKVTGNSNARGWGSSGNNGADCTFTAICQEMTGDVVWDSISTLDLYLTSGSTLTGAIRQDESNAGAGGNGSAALQIENGSAWIVTGDSRLTSLSNAGTIRDGEGKSVTVVGADGTVYVSGESSYTITVDTYSTETDCAGASAVTAFEDAQVNSGYASAGFDMGGMTPPDGMQGGEAPAGMPEGNAPGGDSGMQPQGGSMEDMTPPDGEMPGGNEPGGGQGMQPGGPGGGMGGPGGGEPPEKK